MNESLNELQSRYNELCQTIAPSEHEYTFRTDPQDDGSHHVELIDPEFHYVVTERGCELERRSTADINEMLYWMIHDLTFWMGVAYEFKHRIEEQDCRRIIFAKQIEMMKRADPEMTDRLKLHIAETLSKHPFNDVA